MPTLDNVRRPGRRVAAHKPRKVEPVAVPDRPAPPDPPPRALALFNAWRSCHMARDWWKARAILAELEALASRPANDQEIDE